MGRSQFQRIQYPESTRRDSSGRYPPAHVKTAVSTKANTTAGAITPVEMAGTITDGTPAGRWAATGLPTGLAISATTGQITGTPTAAGTFTTKVYLKNPLGVGYTNAFSWVITTP